MTVRIQPLPPNGNSGIVPPWLRLPPPPMPPPPKGS